jgi:2-octaprenylphenol hydroxylase
MTTQFDVLIVGGGMVGSALACALGDSRFKVCILDNRAPTPPSQGGSDSRVSAITLAARNFFQNLDVWRHVERASPVEAMHIWETQGQIRFDAAEIGEACLAYIVENAALQHALIARMQVCANVQSLWPVIIEKIEFEEPHASVTLKDGRRLTARLLIGADGADSAVRRAAGIDVRRVDMHQKGIVANVHTEQPHGHIARQRFLPTGPLALLPLSEPHICSIVWSADNACADTLMELNDAAFIESLQAVFGDGLGKVLSVSRRQAFPLALAQAHRYTAPRLALIGDAAHVVHPLAGQGVNLGFLDAAALADTLLAAKHGVDAGTHARLRRYERARKGDNLGMIAVTGGFKYLFGNELPWVRRLRNTGLKLANVITPAKRSMMRRAAGLSGDIPSLARPRGLMK